MILNFPHPTRDLAPANDNRVVLDAQRMMIAVAAKIINSTECTALARSYLIWMLGQTQRLIFPVGCSLWYSPVNQTYSQPEQSVTQLTRCIEAVLNPLGSTDLNGVLVELNFPYRFSYSTQGGFRPSICGGGVYARAEHTERVITVWLSTWPEGRAHPLSSHSETLLQSGAFPPISIAKRELQSAQLALSS